MKIGRPVIEESVFDDAEQCLVDLNVVINSLVNFGRGEVQEADVEEIEEQRSYLFVELAADKHSDDEIQTTFRVTYFLFSIHEAIPEENQKLLEILVPFSVVHCVQSLHEETGLVLQEALDKGLFLHLFGMGENLGQDLKEAVIELQTPYLFNGFEQLE